MSLQIPNTLFIGKVVIHLPLIKSTNKYAINLLAKSKPSNGTVVFTNNQTEGRGQFGTSWESQAGQNMTLSIIVYPSFLTVNQQFNLNLCVALGIIDFLKSDRNLTGLRIKWPNDIYHGNKKLGGILIQNTINSASIKSSVIGIGLNVNQTTFSDKLPNPVSLATLGGSRYDVEQLVPGILQAIEYRYLQLKANKTDLLLTDYLEGLYLKDIPSVFTRQNGISFKGSIQTINAIGQLVVLNHETNQLESFNLKEIKFPMYD